MREERLKRDTTVVVPRFVTSAALNVAGKRDDVKAEGCKSRRI
jgi:hypothetical protein